MKKAGFITLLVLLLSVSVLVTAENLDGFTNLQGTILTENVLESQAVSAPIFGGLTVLSVSYSEQLTAFPGNKELLANIGLEMGFTYGLHKKDLNNTNIDGSRGDYLHFAGIY